MGRGITIVEFLTTHIYSTMLFGTAAIGLVAGVLGCFIYLRRQSLLADVIGHSATAGVMLAFLFSALLLRIDGREMAPLLIGSIIIGLIAVQLTNRIASRSPLGTDATMAIMLASFYGGGMFLLRVIQGQPLKGKGGLADYMLGNSATMTSADVTTIAVFGAVALIVMLVFWKEFAVFTFDETYSEVSGFNPKVMGPLMLGTVVIGVVIGIKAVGLILMVAFAIIPPASARQWTKTLRGTVILAGIFGVSGAVIGSWLAVSIGDIPTGPMIVVVLSSIFIFTLLAAPGRSIVQRAINRNIRRKKLLRQLEGKSEVQA